MVLTMIAGIITFYILCGIFWGTMISREQDPRHSDVTTSFFIFMSLPGLLIFALMAFFQYRLLSISPVRQWPIGKTMGWYVGILVFIGIFMIFHYLNLRTELIRR